MSLIRTAAVFVSGAALAGALTVTGMQAWQVSAAITPGESTFVPIEPCRLLDTRVAFNVGPRLAPIGPTEVYVAQVTGTNGECTGIPTDAVGVAMNVTVVGGTTSSNLRLYPADAATIPNVANLNWSPGATIGNKVDSKLSATGEIAIRNQAGSVDVIADIFGVYLSSGLADIESRLAALESEDAALHARITDQRPSTLSTNGGDKTITNAWTNVLQLSAPISRTGTVIVFASSTAFESRAGDDVQCVITDTPGSVLVNRSMMWEASGATSGSTAGQGDAGVMSGTRSFGVTGGTSGTFALMCRNTVAGGTSTIWSPHITVLFIRG